MFLQVFGEKWSKNRQTDSPAFRALHGHHLALHIGPADCLMALQIPVTAPLEWGDAQWIMEAKAVHLAKCLT